MPAIDIRTALAADHEWLYELHETAHRELVEQAYGPWDAVQQREFFRSLVEGHDVYVIEEDGYPVGAVYLGVRERDAWLELIEVTPGHQQRGLGTEALCWIIRRATEQGRGTSLQVHRMNLAAHRWYLRQGFAPVGETETHFLLRYP